jgi:oligoendopeptidase F
VHLGLALLLAAMSFALPASIHAQADPTWDLSDLYPDVEAWEKALAETKGRLAELEPLKGSLGRSPASLKKALDLYYDLRKEAARLRVYASLLSDMDTRESKPQGMKQETAQLRADFKAASAWIDPEILAIPARKIERFLAAGSGLEPYRRHLERLEKKRRHTLDADNEEILGMATLLEDGGQSVGNLLLDAEIPWETITLADGTELRVDVSGYTRGRASSNRLDRIKTYDAFFTQLGAFQQTLATSLAASVKEHVFKARVRGYDGTLEAALFPDEIPTAVYEMLVEEVNRALPTLHRYLRLRARMLGVSDLGYHDLYPSLVGEVEADYSWEASKELVFDALAPMGEEYVDYLRQACEKRWVDVFPREGKRSGAYMSGSAYDVHPYMLLNHLDTYRSASTLAHEGGHMMHSKYSSEVQPYATSSYETFVAEVASITDEWLLFKHSLSLAADDQQRLAILGNFLEAMRLTVFRQTMFAEFELAIHRLAEEGKPLTAEILNRLHLDLLKRYHGHDQGMCRIDDMYQVEWAFIPHFHYNFYVYSYSTSFIAATAFQEQILAGEKGGARAYIDKVLKAGSSKPPVEILSDAGVDMTTPEPFRAFVRAMDGIMDQIEEILDRQATT